MDKLLVARPAARRNRHRDLRPRAAAAAGEGLRLAERANARDGRRRRHRGRCAGGRGGPRRLDEARSTAQRAADPSLDHDDPIEEVFEDQLACADLVVAVQDRSGGRGRRSRAIEAAIAAAPCGRACASSARDGGSPPAVLLGLGAAAEDDLAARQSHHGRRRRARPRRFRQLRRECRPPASPSAARADRRGAAAAGRAADQGPCARSRQARAGRGAGGRARGSSCRSPAGRCGRREELVVIGLKGFDGEAVRRALERIATSVRCTCSSPPMPAAIDDGRGRASISAGDRRATSWFCRRPTPSSRRSRPRSARAAGATSRRCASPTCSARPSDVGRPLCRADAARAKYRRPAALGGEGYWPLRRRRACGRCACGAAACSVPAGRAAMGCALAARGTVAPADARAVALLRRGRRRRMRGSRLRYCRPSDRARRASRSRQAAAEAGARPAGVWRAEPRRDAARVRRRRRSSSIARCCRGRDRADRRAVRGAGGARAAARADLRHQPQGRALVRRSSTTALAAHPARRDHQRDRFRDVVTGHGERRRCSTLDCPVLQVALAGISRGGLGGVAARAAPRDLAMHVVLPEVDGRIFARRSRSRSATRPTLATARPVDATAGAPTGSPRRRPRRRLGGAASARRLGAAGRHRARELSRTATAGWRTASASTRRRASRRYRGAAPAPATTVGDAPRRSAPR